MTVLWNRKSHLSTGSLTKHQEVLTHVSKNMHRLSTHSSFLNIFSPHFLIVLLFYPQFVSLHSLPCGSSSLWKMCHMFKRETLIHISKVTHEHVCSVHTSFPVSAGSKVNWWMGFNTGTFFINSSKTQFIPSLCCKIVIRNLVGIHTF